MTNWCRLCGKNIIKTDLSFSLDDEIDVNITFKFLIEYYCRIKLDDKSSLPQNVCNDCRTIIDNFIKFCDKSENFQIKLKDDNNNILCIVKSEDEPIIVEEYQNLLEEIIQEDKQTSIVVKKVKKVKKEKKLGRVNNIHN